MYSLKVILLLNCVSQGDLNSKRMSLNFFKVSQPLCSFPPYSILLPPIFPLQVKCASFICPIGRDIFPRSLLGNTKSLKYMLLWYFAILTFFLTLSYGFSFRILILQGACFAKLIVLYYDLWGLGKIIWALSNNYCYLNFHFFC